MYCYGRYTKFNNNCLRWFLYNKSKNAIEYENLCFENDAYVEDREDDNVDMNDEELVFVQV